LQEEITKELMQH